MPDIPAGWLQATAAAGAILVVIAILKWTWQVLDAQSKHSQSISDKAFDLLNKIVNNKGDPHD